MFLIDNAVLIRLGSFTFIFVVMALGEKLAPRHALNAPKGMRWLHNLSITFLNSAAVKLVFPITATGVALITQRAGYGLLNSMGTSFLLGGFIAIIALDLAIYFQHDPDIDVTTGARFHPIEILLSMVIKMSVVVLIGAPAWSVLGFEVLLNATSMFNHSNILIKSGIDRILRRIVVTPDMHRAHHSVIFHETNGNYGFNLPWWDRLFGSYKDQPSKGHDSMIIGLANYRDPKYLTLHWMLAIPFLKKVR